MNWHGIPNCGATTKATKRPGSKQGKKRCTRRKIRLEDDESEEEVRHNEKKACVDASDWPCAGLEGGSGPFVIDSAGCPMGLSVQEQVKWARETDHPMMDFPKVDADTHLWEAIAFEMHTDLKEIDNWRKTM